jgi:diguanylate cyclase (GGDEF)-like protein/PAS domain S-box-containing protein
MWRDEDFFRKLLDNLYDGIYFVDRDRVINFWNKGSKRLSGYAADEVVGLSCKDNILVHVDDEGHELCKEGCPLAATMEDGEERQAEVYMRHREGHRIPVLVRVAPIHDRDGKITGAVEIFSDNSNRTADQQKIEELQHMVFLDPLTALANRRYLDISLRSRLEEMNRYGWGVGLLFFDVDHFKNFNDRYGHEVGDEVLKMVAKSLSNCSRVYDTVGRWGGEEFVAIITNIGRENISGTAERYRQVVEHSGLAVDGEMLRVTVSVGATIAVPGDTTESLLARADELMYKSKLAGRNRVSSDQ